MKMDILKQPHRRFNPLIREWILVSPHRTARPWQGQVEEASHEKLPQYDPSCYLCPGNVRANGEHNPRYDSTFVFDNDFAALRPDVPLEKYEEGLLLAETEPGTCRVVCFSPRHDLTISVMEVADIRKVVDVWAGQYVELGALPGINSVQIFENRGAMMGASNPHPHCQVWAQKSVPNETVKEVASMREYTRQHQSCLLCDYFSIESEKTDRLVCDNDHFAALVPFWAVWPFEIMVVSKHHVTGIDQLNGDERTGLADILNQVTSRYDRVFDSSFPYSMGFHQRPTDGEAHAECHLHVHFLPPLLRSATVRKFMVGYELLGMPQRDITAEDAASRLREV